MKTGFFKPILSIFGVALATPANADSLVEGIPTGWRLQNYVGDGVNVWFTGSTCTYGGMAMGPSATADDKNRFYSMIMTAKVSGQAVGVYYETSSGHCYVTSFYMKP